MRPIFVFAFLVAASAAVAQTPTGGQQQGGGGSVRTPVEQNGPFGSQWSKPTSQTGGTIYMDPRVNTGPQRPRNSTQCPGGRTLRNGVCQ